LVRQRLERDYEDALRRYTECELTLARLPPPAVPATNPDDAQTLLQVAGNVQQVWDHPAVTNEERKELLRALLERIVCVENTPGLLDITLHWHGGTTSSVRVYRPNAVKSLILDQWHTGATTEEIAVHLNAAGLRTRQRRPWSAKTIENTLYIHARETERWHATRRRLWELRQHGLRGRALADRLNAESWRSLGNHLWTRFTVGIELQVMIRAATAKKKGARTRAKAATIV
jgi:hypothetical protein